MRQLFFFYLDSICVQWAAKFGVCPFDDVRGWSVPSCDVIKVFHWRWVSLRTFIVNDLFRGRALNAKRFGGFPSAIWELNRFEEVVSFFCWQWSHSLTMTCKFFNKASVLTFVVNLTSRYTHPLGKIFNMVYPYKSEKNVLQKIIFLTKNIDFFQNYFWNTFDQYIWSIV